MANVLSLILGGGQGTRLYPLTKMRSKPAVPIGGKYRIIDLPISNCLNSGFNRVYVLTQFASVSLHRHISNTYKFDPFHHAWVEVLAAQQTLTSKDWYQGTADAVRQNRARIESEDCDHVLILSGDQLYRMDYRELLSRHLETQADATLGALPVERHRSKDFGIINVDSSGRIESFVEKPTDPTALDQLAVPEDQLREMGIAPQPGRDLLANMGIYIFKKDVLLEVLEGEFQDFGKHVFPAMVHSHHLQTHLFDGYWEDIGTVASFHRANIGLAADPPNFVFNVPGWVIYTRARFLPASRLSGANVQSSLIADGCVIGKDSIITRSVVGVRSHIGEGVQLRDCVHLGVDFYETAEQKEENRRRGIPDIGVGSGSRVEHAIIDKNCHIGRNVTIRGGDRPDGETELYVVRDGIVVIPKGTVVPDGTVV